MPMKDGTPSRIITPRPPVSEVVVQDELAELIERHFTNICLNDLFLTDLGRPAPCDGDHPKKRKR